MAVGILLLFEATGPQSMHHAGRARKSSTSAPRRGVSLPGIIPLREQNLERFGKTRREPTGRRSSCRRSVNGNVDVNPARDAGDPRQSAKPEVALRSLDSAREAEAAARHAAILPALAPHEWLGANEQPVLPELRSVSVARWPS
jgi:hypothetical protein